MRSKTIATKAGLTAALALSLLGAHTTPAQAASWHGIEGTVYQKSTTKFWFNSDKKRIKDGSGPVRARFSDLPRSGITFKIRDGGNQLRDSSQSWAKDETGVTRTLVNKVPNGKAMYTSFKQYKSCDRCSPYNFKGWLYY